MSINVGIIAWVENYLIEGEQTPWRDWTSWQQEKNRESRNGGLTWDNSQWNATGGVSRETDKAGMTGDKETRKGWRRVDS